jgi:REP element-mobilizing transposase RayT
MHKIFGKIVNEKMIMNEIGKTAEKYWMDIPIHYPHMELDEYVIMPNHVHGIINIIEDITIGAKNDHLYVGAQNSVPHIEKYTNSRAQNSVPLQNAFQHIIPRSICSAIRGYKIGVTKWVHQNTIINHIWQRNYYEHIIQNDDELNRIRDYIQYNPLNWQLKKVDSRNIWD